MISSASVICDRRCARRAIARGSYLDREFPRLSYRADRLPLTSPVRLHQGDMAFELVPRNIMHPCAAHALGSRGGECLAACGSLTHVHARSEDETPEEGDGTEEAEL